MDGWRILLVEDERLLERVVTELLRTASLTCEVAHSGKEALERLQGRLYDLLILDLRLPDTTGSEILRRVRQLHPQLPVVLVTAYTAGEELAEATAYAPNAVLYKPFDLETLLATVWNLLRKHPTFVPTQAVVSMADPSPLAPVALFPSGQEPVTLILPEAKLVGRVLARDDYLLSVHTALPQETNPIKSLEVEWVGSDALYRFRSRVAKQISQEESMRWLLHLPRVIHRLQRRRYPRLPAEGQVMVSVVGRVQRAIRGQLVDISQAGIGVSLPMALNRGASVSVSVEGRGPEGLVSFQSEGTVRHVVAYAEGGNPMYRVGIQLVQVPRAVRDCLLKCQQRRLQGITS